MERHDIVYILKEDIDTYELTYSLRSVDKNFITEEYGHD